MAKLIGDVRHGNIAKLTGSVASRPDAGDLAASPMQR